MWLRCYSVGIFWASRSWWLDAHQNTFMYCCIFFPDVLVSVIFELLSYSFLFLLADQRVEFICSLKENVSTLSQVNILVFTHSNCFCLIGLSLHILQCKCHYCEGYLNTFLSDFIIKIRFLSVRVWQSGTKSVWRREYNFSFSYEQTEIIFGWKISGVLRHCLDIYFEFS